MNKFSRFAVACAAAVCGFCGSASGTTDAGALPDGYERLGGVGAAKGQMVVTDYVPKENSVYHFAFSVTRNGSRTWRGIFGNYTSEEDNVTRLTIYNGDDTSFLCNNISKAGGGGSKAAGVNTFAGQRVDGMMDSTRCVLTGGSGTPVEAMVNVATGNANDTPLRLLGSSPGDQTEGIGDFVQMYSFRIEEKVGEELPNEVVHDYVPALRTSDKAVGFYDTVENLFWEPEKGSEPLVPLYESALSDGFERLSGVRATQGQMVTTDYVPKKNSVYHFAFSADTGYDRWRGVFGNFKGEDDNATRVIVYDNDNTSFLCNNISKASGGGKKAAGVNTLAGQRVDGMMDSTRCVLTGGSGTPVEVMVNVATGNPNDTPLRLLGSGSLEGTGFVEMYSFRIEEMVGEDLPNVVVHDYVPARRMIDKKVGFYDVVEERFLAPNGSALIALADSVQVSFKSAVADERVLKMPFGSAISDSVAPFVTVDGVRYECLGYTVFASRAGDVMKEYASGDRKSFSMTLPASVSAVQVLWRYIPASYGLVEYLKSSGTEYVNTGHVTTEGTEFRFKYALQTGEGHSYAAAFGTYNGESENCTRIIANGTSTTTLLVNFMNRAEYCSEATLVGTLKSMDVVEGVLNAQAATINGTSTVNHSNVSQSPDVSPVSLFKCNLNSTARNAVQYWYMQIWEDGFLIHSYLPCSTPTGEGVMYDIVTGETLHNLGEGAFVCGPKIKRQQRGLAVLLF